MLGMCGQVIDTVISPGMKFSFQQFQVRQVRINLCLATQISEH
jgi:hypothetical protein